MPISHLTVSLYAWLVLIGFVVALVTRRLGIPYALALVATGLLLGFPHLLPRAHLDPNTVFSVFLPPLLFEGAINLRAEHLRRDALLIGILTVAGTVASSFIVGLALSASLHISIRYTFVFGALISSTDPMAVLAVFRKLGAPARLTTVMEAESLFNDAVAVVLFTVAVAASSGHGSSWGAAALQFLWLAVGGAGVGLVIGGVASLAHYELDDHLVEITLTTVVAYGAYMAGQALGVSGVMAVVTAGLAVGNIAMPRAMTAGTRLAIRAFWEYVAFAVNSVVFLLVGIEVGYVSWAHRALTAIVAVAAVFAGRAAIYPLAWAVHQVRPSFPGKWVHVLFWGGLRGALAMALVLGLPQDFPYRSTLVIATFAVVAFSLLLQGTTTTTLLRRLRLTVTAPRGEPPMLSAAIAGCRSALVALARYPEPADGPHDVNEKVEQEYRARLEALEAEANALSAADGSADLAARRVALEAEKAAILDEEREGRLSATEMLRLTERINRELEGVRALVHQARD